MTGHAMIRCVIIDDEPMAIDILKEYVDKVPFLRLDGTYRDAVQALEDLQKTEIGLVFLDINMPDLTGIQFLDALTYSPLVIFTTAYSEYAVDSYNYRAVDYLLKPIGFERFLKAANRALELFRNDERSQDAEDSVQTTSAETALIKSGTEYHQVRIDDIYYIEGAGNYVTFVTSTGKIMSLMSMKGVLELLGTERFIRIHKSYIAAARHIGVIEAESVKINRKKLPVGEAYRRNLDEFVRRFRLTPGVNPE